MIVRNKIWEELKQAHANVLCIKWYNDRQRKFNRGYQLFIAIIASSGTFGYLLNDYAPLIGSAIIAFVSVTKSIFPHFLQSEQELCDLDRIMDYYNSHMNDIECLFYQLDQSIITDNIAMEMLYYTKAIECKKQSEMNRLIRHISKKRKDKIVKTSEEYIDQVYFNIYN